MSPTALVASVAAGRALAAGLALASTSGRARLAEQVPSPPVAFTNVTVIDGNGGAPARGRTVVVVGGRITALGPAGRTRVPPGTSVVDGRGRFLIPGLWDMHVHQMSRARTSADATPAGREASRAALAALLLAHGVTGVRDMSGDLSLLVQWREAVRRGAIVAPRMFVTGRKLGDDPAVTGAPFPVGTEDNVRQSIALLRAGGADFVKVGSGLRPELLPVAVAEAQRAGLVVVGHVPAGMTADEASREGMRGIEHLAGVLLFCDTNQATVRGLRARSHAPVTLRERIRRVFGGNVVRAAPLPAAAAGFSDARAELLAELLARRGTWQTPTLRRWHHVYNLDPVTGNPDERRIFALYQRVVLIMNQRGVRFLAGTDTHAGGPTRGDGLDEELEELVQAGLTPLQALRAATRNPAEFLGVLDSLGTVEQGKVADLVLLDADPSRDVTNVRRVNAVMVAGRLLRHSDLVRLGETVRVAP